MVAPEVLGFGLGTACGGAAWSVTHSYKELLVFDAQLRASAAPAALALAELPVARGPSVIRLGAVQSWLKELLDAIAAGRLVDGGGALHLLSRCAPFLQLHVPPIVKLQVRATPPYLRAQPCTALHSPTAPHPPAQPLMCRCSSRCRHARVAGARGGGGARPSVPASPYRLPCAGSLREAPRRHPQQRCERHPGP